MKNDKLVIEQSADSNGDYRILIYMDRKERK